VVRVDLVIPPAGQIEINMCLITTFILTLTLCKTLSACLNVWTNYCNINCEILLLLLLIFSSFIILLNIKKHLDVSDEIRRWLGGCCLFRPAGRQQRSNLGLRRWCWPPDLNVLHNTKRIYAKTFFVQVGSRGMTLNHNRKLIFHGNHLFSKSRLAGFGSAANRAEDLGVWTWTRDMWMSIVPVVPFAYIAQTNRWLCPNTEGRLVAFDGMCQKYLLDWRVKSVSLCGILP
jgi:hypothetical protein